MELIKKEIKYFQPVWGGKVMHEESADMIVPDSEADVKKVCGATASVYIKEKNLQNDRILVSGTVRTTVFYIPEDGDKVKTTEIPINFVHIEEINGVSPQSSAVIGAEVRSVEAGAANPRKFSVKTAVLLDFDVYGQKTAEVAADVDFEPEEQIQVLKRNYEEELPACFCEKNFNIIDSVEAPEQGGGIISVCCERMKTLETRTMAGKAVIKGQAELKMLCRDGDGNIYKTERNVPFSQIAEAPGITDGGQICCAYCIKSCEAEKDAESEGKYYDVRMAAEMTVISKEKREIEVLSDLYSTAGSVECAEAELNLSCAAQTEAMRREITHQIDVKAKAGDVLDVCACMGECRASGADKLSLNGEAYINVLFCDADGTAQTCAEVVPISFEAPAGFDGRAELCAEDVRAAAVDGGKIQVKFTAVCTMHEQPQIKIPFVESAQMGTEDDSAHKYKNASVILRYASQNEDLWQTAKKYGSTVNDIEQANAITHGQAIESGRLIIIPIMV